MFIDEYIAGKLPRDIFIKNGFDIEMIGMKRVEQSADRWKKLMIKAELYSNERPSNRELTKEEIIERQEAKIKLLEAQLEL